MLVFTYVMQSDVCTVGDYCVGVCECLLQCNEPSFFRLQQENTCFCVWTSTVMTYFQLLMRSHFLVVVTKLEEILNCFVQCL